MRLSFQVFTSRGQSVALRQQEDFEGKRVSLSLLRNVVNKVCGLKDVVVNICRDVIAFSNKAEKGDNFKQRNFELPEEG